MSRGDLFGGLAPTASSNPPVDAAAPDPCRDADGGSLCPLLSFMESELAPALTERRWRALEQGFLQLAARPPAGAPNWASISRDGAAAAKLGEHEAVVAACRGCHQQYRGRYQHEHRHQGWP